jgi:hypothetical protein
LIPRCSRGLKTRPKIANALDRPKIVGELISGISHARTALKFLRLREIDMPRIRYYGLLGNRDREEKLTQCRQLLKMEPQTPTKKTDGEAPADYRDRYQALTGVSLHQCPMCHSGRMFIVEQIIRPTTRITIDTSRGSRSGQSTLQHFGLRYSDCLASRTRPRLSFLPGTTGARTRYFSLPTPTSSDNPSTRQSDPRARPRDRNQSP